MFDRKGLLSVFISRFLMLPETCWGRIKIVLNDQGRPAGEDLMSGFSFLLGHFKNCKNVHSFIYKYLYHNRIKDFHRNQIC
jgi:hypothetical protein